MSIQERNILVLAFAAGTAFLLSACNLSVITPAANTPVVFSSETPVILTDTPTAIPSATSTATPLVDIFPASPTMILSPTATLLPAATPTPTLQWSVCPGIVITRTDTNSGDMLHVLRCEDGLEYDLGPLAQGAYAVAPNDKFLAYVTVDGIVYAARIGSPYFVTVFNLETERVFTALNKKVNGDFQLSFTGSELNYQLVILERKYGQKRVYDLPVTITR